MPAHPLARVLRLGAAFLLTAVAASAGLVVFPATISNAYNGAITLTVSGLDSPGQTVVVEKFYDSDGSNSVTGGDFLEQRFKVTDGQVTSLGGRRNLSVPGDEDGSSNGSIETKVYFAKEEITGRLDGRYIFRVSPDGAGFTPATGNLVVTQQDQGGSGLQGRVTAGAVPQAGKIVLITSAASNHFDVAGITVTDGAGNFSLKMPAGNYRPIPVGPGFVCDLTTAAATPVTAGSFATSPDALLAAAARTIAGTVREDAPPYPGLPAMTVFGQSSGGAFALAFADAAGNFSLPAAAGDCAMGVLELPLATLGVLSVKEFTESSPGNVTGLHIDLPRATALVYGRLSTPANVPLPYVVVQGRPDGFSQFRGSAITHANGDYTVGVTTGSWRVAASVPGYLIAEAQVTVNSAGTAVPRDLTAFPITAHLRGQVRDNLNNPLPNVEILAQDYQGTNSMGFTDANGNFDLGVYGGPGGTAKRWSIQLNQGSGTSLNYVSTVVDFQVVDGIDINGISYPVHLVTAHLRGHVLDENNAPVGGFNAYASGQNNNFLNGCNVQGDGSFDIPVFGGNWQIGINNEGGLGLLPQANLPVSVVDGTDQNGLVFHVQHTTGTITGSVKNSQGTGLGGIQVFANVTVSGVAYANSTVTAGTGSYSLPVFAGTWSAGVVSADLQNQGYQPVQNQSVFINSGSVIVDFTATGGQSFGSWQAGKFTLAEIGVPALSGPQADFDKDGISNLMEYALHLEPKTSDAGGLPVPGRLPGWLTLTFTRPVSTPDLSYSVVESTSPAGPWVNIAAPFEQVATDGTTDTVRAKIPVDGTARKFMRLQVVRTGP